jgi:hypothetical protein
MNSQSLRTALAAGLVGLATLVGGVVADAAPMPMPTPAPMSMQPGVGIPGVIPLRHSLLPTRTAAVAPRAAASGIDTTPPVLTGFSVGSTVDASLAFAQLPITLKGTDDYSGISVFYIYAQGPNGQWISTAYAPGFQVRKASSMAAFNFTSQYPSGTWVVQEVDVYDNAGNITYYDHAALAALGNAQFTVLNTFAPALDTSPPAMVSGVILTPTISLSSFAKGSASNPPVAGMQVDIVDTGTPRVSGVQWAQAYFCDVTALHCFSTYQQETLAGNASKSARTSGWLYAPYLAPGDYYLYYMVTVDFQGNYQFLTSQRFGGETDFSTLLPGGQVITLTP